MYWEAGDAVLGVKKITKIGHDQNAKFMYPKKCANFSPNQVVIFKIISRESA